jgi:hypothetical protein
LDPSPRSRIRCRSQFTISRAICSCRQSSRPLPGAEGWHTLALANGERAAIFLEITSRAETKFGPRAALAFDVKGRATLETNGYLIAGDVLANCSTRAFLQVECRLEALGKVA